MKNIKRTVQFSILAGLFMLIGYSCAEKNWNNYYTKQEYLKEGSAVSFLAGKPEYSQFTSLLKKTGNDSLLSQGGSFTVFAVKNGAFTGIDTTTNLIALKKIIGMHVLSITLFKEKLSGYYLSIAGKPLRFSTESGINKVNTIKITDSGTRVFNGMVYDSENLILPLPNILDFLYSDSSYSYWKQLVDSSYTKVIDPALNIRTGYDTLGLPVYKPPFIYKLTSGYLSTVNIDKENILSTMFVPSATAMNDFYASMIAARGGDRNLIVPKVGALHGDTTIGGYFIPRNVAYQGDTAVFLTYLNNNVVVNKEISALLSGVNSFVNIAGNTIGVNKSDVVNNSARYASNGYLYTVNKLTLPDLAFRRSFIIYPSPTLTNKANVRVTNPDYKNVAYRNGFTYTATSLPAESGLFTTFDFKMIGAEMDITFPFIPKGNYKLSIHLNNNGSNTGNVQGYFEVYYNSVMLTRFTDYTINAGNTNFKMFLSNLNVAVNGPVKITFRMADLGSGAGSTLVMSRLYLDPTN